MSADARQQLDMETAGWDKAALMQKEAEEVRLDRFVLRAKTRHRSPHISLRSGPT